MTIDKVNLAAAFGSFDEQWSPRLAGVVNDTHIKLARIEGDFVWHQHEGEDEMFLIVKGALRMHLREASGGGVERAIDVSEGEMIVIPKGVEHNPETIGGECWVLLVELAATQHTGNVVNERTVHEIKPLGEA